MGMEKQKLEQKEIRKCKAIVGNPGGNASKGAKNYRVAIPPVWAQAMGITSEERDLLLTFDGESVIIKKEMPEE